MNIFILILRYIKIILLNSFKFNEIKKNFEKWKSLIKNKIKIDDKIIDSNWNQFIYVVFHFEKKNF
jgi:hypothetical protein